MNWLTKTISRILPKKKASLDVPANSWSKCGKCQNMVYYEELEKNLYCCPSCDFHFNISPRARFKDLFDRGEFEEIEYSSGFSDPLNFKDVRSYKDRWNEARNTSGTKEVFLVGIGEIKGIKVCVAHMNYFFLAGSVGQAGAEGLVKAAEECVTRQIPLVVFCTSGGMRMQTGVLSLATLQKCTIAMQIVKDAKMPIINCWQDPLFGGTTASFASLGDIILAEPGARAGFAGKRVVEQTINEPLPADFQTTESLFSTGFIDQIVHRKEMKNKIVQILSLLLKRAA